MQLGSGFLVRIFDLLSGFSALGSDFRAGVRIVRSAEVRCKFPDMGPERVYGGVSNDTQR